MLAGMFLIGSWLAKKIETGVTQNAAITTALLMDSFIAPLAQELSDNDTLSIGPIRALDEVLDTPALKESVVSIKIWKPGGLIAYSDNLDLIGKIFEPADSLKKAWAGMVVSELEDLSDEENKIDRKAGIPLLEIYSPIRAQWSGEIIAVAEFYEDASDLKNSLVAAKRQGWLVVSLTTLAMGMCLYAIVLRGSRTIEHQGAALRDRVGELRMVSEQNLALKERIMHASGRSAELNEQFLRRVSSDLHDGPAQLVSLAALRLDSLGTRRTDKIWADEISAIKVALDDAMRDIRGICKGLSVPEIETKTIRLVIEEVIQLHQNHTGSEVGFKMVGENRNVRASVKICVYRFVQEGLNNAYHHANGLDQQVFCNFTNNTLELTVSNNSNKAAIDPSNKVDGGLGLPGLQERIEALGGEFSFSISSEGKAELKMTVST